MGFPGRAAAGRVADHKENPGLQAFRSQSRVSCAGAGNGIRTRDPNLGKVVLYQLSYSRKLVKTSKARAALSIEKTAESAEPRNPRHFTVSLPFQWSAEWTRDDAPSSS